ncbi:MAG TPA: erythromycin esterase family protein, partial [Roseiflexaceae bacterium]|nr:erythromycin esterase family protein [Roseiflexaceae bacterium]
MQPVADERAVVDALHAAAQPLTGGAADYDALLERIGAARFVLIGEASHGTHEFYRQRALLTRRLIEQRGFTAVAVEADWPDAYRVNRYVRGTGDGATAIEALSGFRRFPAWMWRNADVLDFVGWLREHNDACPDLARKAGFYGIDLYSLYGSIEAVLTYLERVNPEAARQARERYGCFEQFGPDPQHYGYATTFGAAESCADEVVNQLLVFQRHTAELMQRDGHLAQDEFFFAEQNARLVKNAEAYYRAMFHGRESWNLRDTHMAETLDALAAHLEHSGRPARIVVWAHNSHLGDARATQMGQQGELNVGQLMRERHGRQVFNIGFSTYSGSVTAASDWDAPAERKQVRPALPGSYEALLHRVAQQLASTPDNSANFLLPLRDGGQASDYMRAARLERAIGVIYRPETERQSHYFYAHLADQFDAVVHIDTTRAVEPLERTSTWHSADAP